MQLPLIDDARSIQQAISAVLNALAAGTLDATRARAMLYGLQIAATNARHIASQTQTQKPEEAAVDSSECREREEVSAIRRIEDVAPTEAAQADAIAVVPQTGVATLQQPAEPGSASASEPSGATQAAGAQHLEEAPSVPKPPYAFSDAHSYRLPTHRERILALRHRRPPVTL